MSVTMTLPAAVPEFDSALSAEIAESLFRMTVDQYERLVQTGLLDGQQIELINGLLVKKMGKTPPHSWTVEALREELGRLLPPGWSFRQEQPVAIPDLNEPEPDLAVVRGSKDDYARRYPRPSDVALLAEVADSTLEKDRGPKLLAYARGDIPVYWIVNLIDRQLEIYSGPTAVGYRDRQVIAAGEQAPVILEGKEIGRIPVSAILPLVDTRNAT
jgi:Uma2 family endonuclease